MKNIFLFSICLFILGCSSTKRISKIDLIGTYRWYGFFESGAEFELKSDSTFIYESGNGLAIQKSTGKWTIRNKELIFNSDLQPKDTLIQYFLIKKGIVNNDSITIQAIAENDEFLP